MKVVDLHPSLEEVVNTTGLDRTKLTVGLKMQDDRPDVSAREEVMICDGTKDTIWSVPSLRALLRGDKPAPAIPNEPPPAYVPLFFFIEKHVLTFCDGVGDKTDHEFEEAYSNLRRRPDGRTVSDLHFCHRCFAPQSPGRLHLHLIPLRRCSNSLIPISLPRFRKGAARAVVGKAVKAVGVPLKSFGGHDIGY